MTYSNITCVIRMTILPNVSTLNLALKFTGVYVIEILRIKSVEIEIDINRNKWCPQIVILDF